MTPTASLAAIHQWAAIRKADVEAEEDLPAMARVAVVELCEEILTMDEEDWARYD